MSTDTKKDTRIVSINLRGKSDGTGATCPHDGYVPCVDYFELKIAGLMAKDKDFHIYVPGDHTVKLSKPHDGYSAFERQRSGSTQIDRLVYGHPKGPFKTLPQYYIHVKHLELEGKASGKSCTCVNCTKPDSASSPPRGSQADSRETAAPSPSSPPRASAAMPPSSAPSQPPSPVPPRYSPPNPPSASVIHLYAPRFSDGTYTPCKENGALRDDDWFLDAIPDHLARNGGMMGPGPYKLKSLPYGYSGWKFVGGKDLRRVFSGHPSGKDFTHMTDLVDHFYWLEHFDLRGQNLPCPCHLCSSNPRDGGERGVRWVKKAKEDPTAAGRMLFCMGCRREHAVGVECKTGSGEKSTG